jgi:hypothetical protein
MSLSHRTVSKKLLSNHSEVAQAILLLQQRADGAACRSAASGHDLKTRLLAAYLENLFKILPAGVVSKKLIGDLNMAKAILSCSFREACMRWRSETAGWTTDP